VQNFICQNAKHGEYKVRIGAEFWVEGCPECLREAGAEGEEDCVRDEYLDRGDEWDME
jgi:hypothetical protein